MWFTGNTCLQLAAAKGHAQIAQCLIQVHVFFFNSVLFICLFVPDYGLNASYGNVSCKW